MKNISLHSELNYFSKRLYYMIDFLYFSFGWVGGRRHIALKVQERQIHSYIDKSNSLTSIIFPFSLCGRLITHWIICDSQVKAIVKSNNKIKEYGCHVLHNIANKRHINTPGLEDHRFNFLFLLQAFSSMMDPYGKYRGDSSYDIFEILDLVVASMNLRSSSMMNCWNF